MPANQPQASAERRMAAGFLSMRLNAEAMVESLRQVHGALTRLVEGMPLWIRLGLARDPGDWPAWGRVAIRFAATHKWSRMRRAGRRAWKLYCEDVSRIGRLDACPRFES